MFGNLARFARLIWSLSQPSTQLTCTAVRTRPRCFELSISRPVGPCLGATAMARATRLARPQLYVDAVCCPFAFGAGTVGYLLASTPRQSRQRNARQRNAAQALSGCDP
ncbi:hypothetical protein VFPPC_16249 [Pochonia chlamydosporia 170]|uniref:Uncharacterized protein n=1 Tax=Pochonia chlamydosporia 170 TaxID=1380566 RepID=A0A179FHI6_METCM|nr:hypothetical protein VFPPC_16249 [Pochonia chlamydosporia 170]OAQ64740.1 hypothetical protein VFPPC_16249 [Pochonia chlamydosporia 170]